jgi:hypothetical protein
VVAVSLVTFDALCQMVFGICLLIAATLVVCCPYQRRAA